MDSQTNRTTIPFQLSWKETISNDSLCCSSSVSFGRELSARSLPGRNLFSLGKDPKLAFARSPRHNSAEYGILALLIVLSHTSTEPHSVRQQGRLVLLALPLWADAQLVCNHAIFCVSPCSEYWVLQCPWSLLRDVD